MGGDNLSPVRSDPGIHDHHMGRTGRKIPERLVDDESSADDIVA